MSERRRHLTSSLLIFFCYPANVIDEMIREMVNATERDEIWKSVLPILYNLRHSTTVWCASTSLNAIFLCLVFQGRCWAGTVRKMGKKRLVGKSAGSKRNLGTDHQERRRPLERVSANFCPYF